MSWHAKYPLPVSFRDSKASFCLSSLLSAWTILGDRLLFVRLHVSAIKMGTRRITRQH